MSFKKNKNEYSNVWNIIGLLAPNQVSLKTKRLFGQMFVITTFLNIFLQREKAALDQSRHRHQVLLRNTYGCPTHHLTNISSPNEQFY